jgi:hypothetical protein
MISAQEKERMQKRRMPMTSIITDITDLEPRASSEFRLLTANEIDFVAGGSKGHELQKHPHELQKQPLIIEIDLNIVNIIQINTVLGGKGVTQENTAIINQAA